MNEAPRCATCTHWEERVDFHNMWAGPDADVHYRRCAVVPMGESYVPAPDPLPLAVAKDGSDYKADLFTLADFGCVQWAPRETTTTEDRKDHQ